MKNENRVIWMNIGIAVLLTVVVYLVSLLFRGMTFSPDQGASWYYWKLPEPTLWSRLSVWIGYILHQVAVWLVIIKMKKDQQPPSVGLTKYNKWLIGINLFFVGLHFLQGALWYDGLAQDVSVWSSQYSVIVMLVIILILENGRRGLFFGKKVKLPSGGVNRTMKLHGFYIAWAITYTFWFHPIEGTAGHLFGFFYMFLLMAQLSLAGTRFHLNRTWTLLLEVIVLFHGTTVAILQQNGMWSMFFFGFATMFVVTQMYGMKLNKKIKGGITAFYIVFALFVYSGIFFDQNIAMIHQITWIPIVLYGLVFVIVFLLQLPSLFMDKEKYL